MKVFCLRFQKSASGLFLNHYFSLMDWKVIASFLYSGGYNFFTRLMMRFSIITPSVTRVCRFLEKCSMAFTRLPKSTRLKGKWSENRKKLLDFSRFFHICREARRSGMFSLHHLRLNVCLSVCLFIFPCKWTSHQEKFHLLINAPRIFRTLI